MTTREKLAALAANAWWSWNPEVLDLFRRLNPDVFQVSNNNPLPALRAADESLLDDPHFVQDVDLVYDTFDQYVKGAGRYDDAPRTTYFCMEYGLHESLPFYSGGLGVLAGDHAKAASDLGLPFTGIGLLLREGYFRQRFDENGWQRAEHLPLNPANHPLTLVTDEQGDPITVTVHLRRTPLHLQPWRLELGRTTLYLLDTDFDANPAELRPLTRRLYQGGHTVRLQQEIILGIGGIRLLRALGIATDVYHLNEGHCAFLTLELLRERLAAGDARPDAERWIREHCVFTTHTPVPAGHDRFAPGLFNEQMAHFREQLGLSEPDLMAYGRVQPDDSSEAFTMTVLGLKLSRKANGVSKLNGQVARQQWQSFDPTRPVDEVPIGHITNGVHLPTWAVPHARAFLNQRLGNWKAHRHEPGFWEQVDGLSDEDLWTYRCTLRGLLIDFVNDYLQRQSLPQTSALDPDALTIGFARRFATYKRAPLLFSDKERAIRLFTQADRPIQVIYAGKAHPADDGGKRFIHQIYEMSQHEAFQGKVIFLENYNIQLGRMLVSGCDVWLNNPRRPLEASGTSGQKTTIHGGLNLSILDGWWPEGYNGTNGWAIGAEATGLYEDPKEQDIDDARSLYHVLEDDVIPTFYNRDDDGLPHDWIARMRNAMKTLPAPFSAARMVADYIEQMYRAPSPSLVEE